jgi:hypothetical protein
MRKLILAAAIVISSIAGADTGHIHFQKASTYVHPVYNKTLCFDGENFVARVSKCIRNGGRDNDNCTRWGKMTITQPMESTRKVCVDDGGRGNCNEMETVSYVQSRTRIVNYYGPRGNRVVRTEKVRVPSCN